MTTSGPEPRDLLSDVDISDLHAPADTAELAQRSVQASLPATSDVAAPAEAVVRLSGVGVQRNRVDVRQATRIIGSLQEVIAAIGQALMGQPTSRGQIPVAIRRRTALSLLPVPVPGSVQLVLEAPADNGNLSFEGVGREDLASSAASELIKIMERADTAELDEESLVENLKALGPRVARQLQRLASELAGDAIDLEFAWRLFAGESETGHLAERNARRLRDVIRVSRVEAQEVRLVGTLVTISTVRPAAIVLDSGRVLTLEVDEGRNSELLPFFEHRVAVDAEEAITVEDATGRERAKYHLLRIAFASATDKSDEPVVESAVE